ncbi:FAD-dependent monooxygenase yanF [Colletotrichum spaethianum]|uniref:FAD-dependent monooxygenase yanF n=1 Tax=Colletotrichum spaethianum TaxID=700344 RepID=A0AA37PHI8_9PEZI|nr:FAD-dependent monooxygenase yanF [Colletotrichum spaethianum]GKT52327.1 FAD-dependent monooxygenase yanF [Colletotrichum spaethianum]
MQVSKLMLAAALAASHVISVVAQDLGDAASVVEPESFNVAEALLTHGIDVSEIPDLTGVGKRSEIGCSAACGSLQFIYGDAAVETRNETAYTAFVSSYWSANQAEVRPHCIFKPSKPEEVSVVVLLSRLTQCPFAAKSGGHAAMAGASSAEGGITISFVNMKGISLSADKKVASIQPGNIWGDVYEELTKSDLTVIGGRLYNIGVGGLTTGASTVGLVTMSRATMYVNYLKVTYMSLHGQVVIASGPIIRPTATQFPDLYWALRGGGNNFGLVVSFNLLTHPLPGGSMWGGSRTYLENSFPQITEAFANSIANAEEDPKAGMWHVYIYSNGTKLSSTTLYYSEPDGGNADFFSEWNAIPAVSNTTQNRVVAEFAREGMESSPPGLREIYAVISTKANIEIVELARNTYFEEVLAVADVPGIVPALVIQGITVPMLKHMQKNGGNALGLDTEDGPFYIVLISIMWSNKEDDDAVYGFASTLLEKINAGAKARGMDNDYIYLNYAGQFQEAISGYGAENKDRLKGVAKKYDPKEVFQKLQPGYFKLDRGPVSDPRFFNW